MACCGRVRANLGVAHAARRPTNAGAGVTAFGEGRQPAPRRPPEQGATLTLRYLGPGAVTVRGPATGRAYAFSVAVPMRPVDSQDAIVLLKTMYFRQA